MPIDCYVLSHAELAFEYVSGSKGLLWQEYQYGYTSYYGVDSECITPVKKPVATINGYVQLPANDYKALMNAVAKIGPIAMSVDASNWYSYISGIFDGMGAPNES